MVPLPCIDPIIKMTAVRQALKRKLEEYPFAPSRLAMISSFWVDSKRTSEGGLGRLSFVLCSGRPEPLPSRPQLRFSFVPSSECQPHFFGRFAAHIRLRATVAVIGEALGESPPLNTSSMGHLKTLSPYFAISHNGIQLRGNRG